MRLFAQGCVYRGGCANPAAAPPKTSRHLSARPKSSPVHTTTVETYYCMRYAPASRSFFCIRDESPKPALWGAVGQTGLYFDFTALRESSAEERKSHGDAQRALSMAMHSISTCFRLLPAKRGFLIFSRCALVSSGSLPFVLLLACTSAAQLQRAGIVIIPKMEFKNKPTIYRPDDYVKSGRRAGIGAFLRPQTPSNDTGKLGSTFLPQCRGADHFVAEGERFRQSSGNNKVKVTFATRHGMPCPGLGRLSLGRRWTSWETVWVPTPLVR
jgi:hypothetical protein